ncbi:putative mitochondrial protein [Cucumis melo var. makuwa]|uniref:Mitochondrial protein n=2 Tax=Cucumis melo TaxID=3656 RepID=A0A5D3E5Q4_CUCMM|nr:putative mitochondrial protein [Cucumis melo var. makuwa]TYK30950.1 putative mitochondrial protein [Cucumis melo var. makuwa]
MVSNVCYKSTMEPITVTTTLTVEHSKFGKEKAKPFFLGFQIRQEATGIFFSQEKYAKNLISKFGMEKAKPKRTPTTTHLKMTTDISREKVDSSLYRSITGSLLYLTASRPNIAFAMGVCVRYQADPRTSHLYRAKCILKYITDWVRCSDDRKSTSEEYGIAQSTMAFYCDNMSAISISKNPVQHSRNVSTFKGLWADVGVYQRPAWQSIRDRPVGSQGSKIFSGSLGFTTEVFVLVQLYLWYSNETSVQEDRRSVAVTDAGQHSPHAGRSFDPVSSVTVKREVPEVSLPRTSHRSVSSSMSGSRVLVKTVILDSDSSNGTDNVVLSTLFHRKIGLQIDPPSTSPHSTQSPAASTLPASPQTSLPTDEEDASDDTDEDYVLILEDPLALEETTTSTEDPVSFPKIQTSEPQSTEGPGDSSISMLLPGHVGSSYEPHRLPVKGQRIIFTKAGHWKISLNVPSIPINCVSFHSEEGAHKWKYV